MPQISPGSSIPTARYRGAGIHVASVTQSDGTRTMIEAPALLSTGQIRVEFVPSRSTLGLANENTKDKAAPTIGTYEAVLPRLGEVMWFILPSSSPFHNTLY